MSSLSIRKLPQDIEKSLVREAKIRGSTKTELVLLALKQRYHLGDHAERKRNIRQFFGKMTQSEYQSFQKVTRDFSKVEEDLWS